MRSDHLMNALIHLRQAHEDIKWVDDDQFAQELLEKIDELRGEIASEISERTASNTIGEVAKPATVSVIP